MTKMKNRLMVVAALTALMGPPLMASAAVDFTVKIAPPAPRVERVPPPRVGYLWTPGHWAWQNNRHVWVGGVYVRNRPGYVYQQPTWVQRDGGWHQQGGNWVKHDADRDGIPNRIDHDRDNDGTRNSRDDRPHNPYKN